MSLLKSQKKPAPEKSRRKPLQLKRNGEAASITEFKTKKSRCRRSGLNKTLNSGASKKQRRGNALEVKKS
jgi:hypothetical protein